jgi:hypothetical protein
MQAIIDAFERHGVKFTKTQKRVGMTAPEPEGDG